MSLYVAQAREMSPQVERVVVDSFEQGRAKTAADVDEGKVPYHVIPINLAGSEWPATGGRVWFSYLPEFFNPEFDLEAYVSEFETEKQQNSVRFVYANNIASEDNYSMLQAIAGDNFDSLVEELNDLYGSGNADDPASVRALLEKFCTGNHTTVLKKQQVKDGRRTKNMNIDRFYRPNQKKFPKGAYLTWETSA